VIDITSSTGYENPDKEEKVKERMNDGKGY